MIHQDMHDYIGRPVVASSLLSETWDRSGLLPLNGVNGIVGGPGNWKNLVDYIPTGLQSYNPGHASFPTKVAASDAMATLIARTNPSRPIVTPLTIAQDLVEIPKALRDIRKLPQSIRRGTLKAKTKDFADQNLAVQFGWMPFVADLLSILKLGKHIHTRMGEIERLYSGKGLKRRIRLGYWGGERKVTGMTVMSAYLIATCNVESFTTAERWGTVRWKPLYPDLYATHSSDGVALTQAITSVSGISVEGLAEGVWDVLPWTWMCDWFSGIGDALLLHSNTVPAYPDEACIMTRTETKSQFTNFTMSNNIGNGIKGGGGSMTYVTEERYVGNPTTHVHLPMISVKRLSVLGSLFIQRFLRW